MASIMETILGVMGLHLQSYNKFRDEFLPWRCLDIGQD